MTAATPTPPTNGTQRKPMVCFNCNAPGHIASRCPQRDRVEQVKQIGGKVLMATGGKVFNLTKTDATMNPRVTKGTLLVQNACMH